MVANKMVANTKKQLLVVMMLLLGINAYAGLNLPYIISDNMMLQRNKEASIWGKGYPGEKVTVEFAGQKKIAKTDKDGNWMVTLDPELYYPRYYLVSGREKVDDYGGLYGLPASPFTTDP